MQRQYPGITQDELINIFNASVDNCEGYIKNQLMAKHHYSLAMAEDFLLNRSLSFCYETVVEAINKIHKSTKAGIYEIPSYNKSAMTRYQMSGGGGGALPPGNIVLSGGQYAGSPNASILPTEWDHSVGKDGYAVQSQRSQQGFPSGMALAVPPPQGTRTCSITSPSAWSTPMPAIPSSLAMNHTNTLPNNMSAAPSLSQLSLSSPALFTSKQTSPIMSPSMSIHPSLTPSRSAPLTPPTTNSPISSPSDLLSYRFSNMRIVPGTSTAASAAGLQKSTSPLLFSPPPSSQPPSSSYASRTLFTGPLPFSSPSPTSSPLLLSPSPPSSLSPSMATPQFSPSLSSASSPLRASPPPLSPSLPTSSSSPNLLLMSRDRSIGSSSSSISSSSSTYNSQPFLISRPPDTSQGGAPLLPKNSPMFTTSNVASPSLSLSGPILPSGRRCKKEVTDNYCRDWNLKFLGTCPDTHLYRSGIHHKIDSKGAHKLIELSKDTGEYRAIETEFITGWKQPTKPTITKIELAHCPKLEDYFSAATAALAAKNSMFGHTRQLFHGTCEANFDILFEYGLQPPADYEVSPNCTVIGHLHGKLGTSTCLRSCVHCAGDSAKKHQWRSCHMFGLGIYFADQSSKSDPYISDITGTKGNKKDRKMLLVEVLLGDCHVVTKLKSKQEYHDCAIAPHGKDSIMAVGQGHSGPHGLSVINNECTH